MLHLINQYCETLDPRLNTYLYRDFSPDHVGVLSVGLSSVAEVEAQGYSRPTMENVAGLDDNSVD